MKATRRRKAPVAAGTPSYAAPALEKGLEILEILCRSEKPLSQKQIAQALGRSVGEIYRMLTCLVSRDYVVETDDSYSVTTRLFELAHANPPTHRLLLEAAPLMQLLSSDLEQSCHLTVYNQGRQVVVAKVDSSSGMGFSVRVGAELDVLVSASGHVLLAFQNAETRKLRIEESVKRRPEHKSRGIERTLDAVRACGFASIASVQVRGLFAVSFPVLDSQGHAMAALTVPYAERIDQRKRKRIPEVQKMLGAAARELTGRIGGARAAGKAVPENRPANRLARQPSAGSSP
jgi:DNA-binding IclR family transcriptional regulator